MLKILLLDKNPQIRSSIVESLRQKYSSDQIIIELALDVVDAINKVKKDVYSIVITEYNHDKGELTGHDFLERIKLQKLVPWHTSFIILTTPEEKTRDIDKILGAGELRVDDYIYKPFTQDFIAKRILALIDKKNALRKIYEHMFVEEFNEAIILCKGIREKLKSKAVDNENLMLYIKDVIYLELLCYVNKLDNQEVIDLYREISNNTLFNNVSKTGWFSYFYAKALYNLGKYKEAEEISLYIKEKFPNYVDNYELLADIFHADKRDAEAIKVLKEACTQSSLNMERQKYLSEIALLSGNLPVAKESLAKIVTDGQNSCVHSLDDFAHLAHIEGGLGNYDEALKVISDGYDRFAKSDSSAKMVTAVLESQVFAKKGDLDASKSAFEVAMREYKKNPGVEISPDMQLYFGAECLEHGEKELGKQMISSGVGDSPKKYQIEKHLERVLRGEENMKILSQLVDDIGNEGETLFKKAMKRAKGGDYKKAISILIHQKDAEPTNPLNYIQITMMMLFSIENSIKTLADDDFEYENQLEHAKSFINLSERYVNDSNKSDYLKEKGVIEMFLKRLEKKRQEQKLENEKEKNKLQASGEETGNGLDGLDEFIL